MKGGGRHFRRNDRGGRQTLGEARVSGNMDTLNTSVEGQRKNVNG